MAKLSLKKGTTSYLARIFIQDSSSTTGAGLTGLTSGSGSFVCYRARDDDGNAAGTSIALSGGTRGTWSSGGFVEKDSTNMPGVYEFGIPNAALAAGSNSVLIMFKGATNQAPLPLEIELTGWDNQDGVHGGMSALPNTAVTTNGSLITSGAGSDQLAVASGRIDAGKILGTAISTPATAGILDVNVKNMNNVAATAITTIKAVQGLATDGVIVTVSGNVNGSVGSVTGAVGSVTGAVGSVTGNVGGNVVGSVGSVTGAVGSVVGAVGSVTGAVGSVTGNVGGNVTGTVASVVDISTTTLAEPSSVPAATATPLAKINWMATLARNKILQTSTGSTLRNDSDAGTIGTSTVSDDGTTFTRGKFS